MCISFDAARSGIQIVDHIINMYPMVYDSFLTDRMYHLLPTLKDFKLEDKVSKPGSRRVVLEEEDLEQTMVTTGGQIMQLFSKSPAFGEDLYTALSEVLGSNLYVASWRRGTGDQLDSYCPLKGFHVNNVEAFKIQVGKKKLSWSYIKDHSKWAVSTDIRAGFVCIGDINRMETQLKRGGGIICLQCNGCWKVFSKMATALEDC